MNIGDNLLWQQLAPPAPANPFVPFDQIDPVAVIADFRKRLADVEKAIVLAVPGDRIMSMIQLSPEAILIQSDRIGLLGEVTFADWHRDVTGQATGVIDPSITQIRGGVIRTGKVVSLDGYSWLDLDAATTTPFLKCSNGTTTSVEIDANGSFTFGTGTKSLTWDGTDLKVNGNALIDGMSAQDVADGAAAGSAAYSGLSAKLEAGSSYVLTGVAQLSNTGGLLAGDVTWNATTGVVTGGAGGVVMTEHGLTGWNGSAITFSIDNAGNAVFSGNISGGSGTFAGNIESTGGWIHSSGFRSDAYTETIAGTSRNMKIAVVGDPSTKADNGSNHAFTVGMMGLIDDTVTGATDAVGLIGVANVGSTNSIGVYGYGLKHGAIFDCDTGGLALQLLGPLAIDANYGTVTNLDADKLDGNDASAFLGASATAADAAKVGGVALSGLVRLNEVNVQFSTDNGGTWNAVRFKA